MDKDAVEPIQNLWASSTFLGSKTIQPLATYSRSEQTKPFGEHQDHPSGVLQGNVQQVAPTSNRPLVMWFNNRLAQFVSPVARPPGLGSRCTQPAMGGSGPICLPISSHLGQVVEKLQNNPCRRIIPIAPGWPDMLWFWDLLVMPSQIPLSLPNLLTQPFNQTPLRNLSNLNPHVWLLEPQQSKSRLL